MIAREIRHFHLFAGLGGGARGFNQGEARVGNTEAKFRCIGGIDVDPAAIKDFDRLAGVPGTVLDLFSYQQYVDFHGHVPPPGWTEATTADIHRAAHHERPHIVFLSAPCKGFSGLLSEALSKTGKYQALNQLTLRGVWLMLEAWRNDPPELIIFENVPRIANRGRPLLDRIVQLLQHAGYAVAETTHDCGEIGGLAQSRKRFLLVARHREKVPPFLYEPQKHRLRAVGDVLGKLPMPGHPGAGPMHRMPALQWKTWVRLAFVEAGKDWRSLQGLRVEDGVLTDFAIVPDREWNNGALGVNRWQDPAGTVTGNSRPAAGSFSVADPMLRQSADYGQLGVREWDKSTGTVSGQSTVGGGAHAVADPRVAGERHNSAFKIVPWEKHGPAVMGPGGATPSVADPRGLSKDTHHHSFRITRFDEHAGTVTASRSPGGGALCLADPRVGYGAGSHRNKLKVTEWDKSCATVTSAHQVQGGALSVADPRTGFGDATHHNVLHVTDWASNAKTISGANHPSGGALCVADPRNGRHGVVTWEEPAGTVAGESMPSNGKFAVADPRHSGDGGMGKYKVTPYDAPAGTIISGSTTGQGAFAVASPLPNLDRKKGDNYLTGGHYGVIRWGDTAFTVSGSANLDNGWNSVGDPRVSTSSTSNEPEEMDMLPQPAQRLVCVIRALDGTWHRPFTTLELAALQSLVDPEEHLELTGLSDSAWRERIGNAVPSSAARAIAGVMGRTLLLAWAGETFLLSSEPIWVRDVALALSVDVPVLTP